MGGRGERYGNSLYFLFNFALSLKDAVNLKDD